MNEYFCFVKMRDNVSTWHSISHCHFILQISHCVLELVKLTERLLLYPGVLCGYVPKCAAALCGVPSLDSLFYEIPSKNKINIKSSQLMSTFRLTRTIMMDIKWDNYQNLTNLFMRDSHSPGRLFGRSQV